MGKKAFSMLELVFVIVVVGILAAVFIPKYGRDNAGEAAYQIARHIRLAQHHALIENRFADPSLNNWEATLWRITFVDGSDGQCYNVWADRDANGGNPAANERAIDPLTRKYLWGGPTCDDSQTGVNQDVLLWKSFGVSGVSVCGGGNAPKHIAFDNLGRPGTINGTTFTPLAADCVVGIQTSDGHNAEVTVFRETGFVKVSKIDGVAIP